MLSKYNEFMDLIRSERECLNVKESGDNNDVKYVPISLEKLITNVSCLVAILAITWMTIITAFQLYGHIRKRFPIRVNCWFCNKNSTVDFKLWNRWNCTYCEQYNGFTDNGDYNCEITAQRMCRLNRQQFAKRSQSHKPNSMTTNGLCVPCNRNQELKVQQLKLFEPESERCYDQEIVEFKKKLEQTYNLCPHCERVLRRKLNKVKTNILGSKLAEMNAQKLSIYGIGLIKRQHIIIKIIRSFAILSLIGLTLYNFLWECRVSIGKINPAKIDQTVLIVLRNYFELTIKFGSFLWDEWNSIAPGLKTVTFHYFRSAVMGSFLELFFVAILLCSESNRKNMKTVIVLLVWSFKLLLNNWATDFVTNDLIIDSLNLLFSGVMLITSLTMQMVVRTDSEEKLRSGRDGSFHRIYNEPLLDEGSDDNDLHDTSNDSIKTTTDFGLNDSLDSRRLLGSSVYNTASTFRRNKITSSPVYETVPSIMTNGSFSRRNVISPSRWTTVNNSFATCGSNYYINPNQLNISSSPSIYHQTFPMKKPFLMNDPSPINSSSSSCSSGFESQSNTPKWCCDGYSNTFITNPAVDCLQRVPDMGGVNAGHLIATPSYNQPLNDRPIYHRFGMLRTNQQELRDRQCVYNFNTLSNNLPTVKRGSLLRDWQDRTL